MAKRVANNIVSHVTVKDGKAVIYLNKWKIADCLFYWESESSKLNKAVLREGLNHCVVVLKTDVTKFETLTICHQ
jgi:tRNA uridine 5-carbamoylmethylation protein Kti12